MKRERIVRTENIDRQRIKYRVLFGFIFIMCCNGAALPSEDGKMPDWKFSFSLKRIPMIRIFDEIEQKSDFVFAWSCDIDNEIHEEISICVTEEPIQKVMENFERIGTCLSETRQANCCLSFAGTQCL